MTTHIGQDFSTSVRLNLLPGQELNSRIYLQWNVQYVTDTGGITTMHHMTINTHGSNDFNVIVGQDVYSIDFSLSMAMSGISICRYSMRVDHLILLNLASKLLNKAI